MRFEKPKTLFHVARLMAGTSEGLTIDDIAREAGVGRRTAERMRDSLRDIFPTFAEEAEGRTKRFSIRGGLDGFVQAPSVDEFAELEAAVRRLKSHGDPNRAALLQSLNAKVRAALRQSVRIRIAPDLDALIKAETEVLQAGPRPVADPSLLATFRKALKAGVYCSFRYSARSSQTRTVRPYGILFGKAYYLIGPANAKMRPVHWRFDRMSEVTLGDPAPPVPATFSLTAFAAQSFGVFQEDPVKVVLRFNAEAAVDARRFLFHPSQTMEDDADSLIVRLNTGGLLELARHLFTWGDAVEILAPSALRRLLADELSTALIHHERRPTKADQTSAARLVGEARKTALSKQRSKVGL